jgi:hypothetical protein
VDAAILTHNTSAAAHADIRAMAETAVQVENDPTVPDWAKMPDKPTYTAAEVGAATPDDVAAEATARESADDGLSAGIEGIKALIPAQASTANKLADKDFVNSTILNMTANRVYYDAAGNQFPTRASVETANAGAVVYRGGAAYTPTQDDYLYITADEGAPSPFTGGQTRWKFDGGQFTYDIGINEEPFTAAEAAAIGSGITAAIVADITNPDAEPTQNSEKFVKSGGVFSWFGGLLSTLKTTAKTVIGAINELFDGKLDKTAQAADSAKLGGVAAASYALSIMRGTLPDGDGTTVEYWRALKPGTYWVNNTSSIKVTGLPFADGDGAGIVTIEKPYADQNMMVVRCTNYLYYRAIVWSTVVYDVIGTWRRTTTPADLNTWQPLSFTPASGYSADRVTLEYNEVLRQVSLDFQGFLLPDNFAIGATLHTISWPTGFKPTKTRRCLVDVDTANGRCTADIDINPDGTIKIYPILATQYAGNTTLVAGSVHGNAVVRID